MSNEFCTITKLSFNIIGVYYTNFFSLKNYALSSDEDKNR